MATLSEIHAALKEWEVAVDGLAHSCQLVDPGDRLAALVRELAGDKPEPVLQPETYTASGLPRRAASRAREHGARIGYNAASDLFRVEFPNGSSLTALTTLGAKHKDGKVWNAGAIVSRRKGAAPGATVPAGHELEEVLNNFADAAEGR